MQCQELLDFRDVAASKFPAIFSPLVLLGSALGLTRFLSAMLYGIHANDPLTLAGVAILLTLVALAACYSPAHRAMRVDPIISLRYE